MPSMSTNSEQLMHRINDILKGHTVQDCASALINVVVQLYIESGASPRTLASIHSEIDRIAKWYLQHAPN